MWNGDSVYLLHNLVLKDFRIRYRNMSLGAAWSLLNPLIMMVVLTFVFTKIFPSAAAPHFPVFALCGIVPYNFFSIAWSNGTNSIIESSHLIKRIPVPREIVPIASVLSNCVHLLIQIGLLLLCVLVFGIGISMQWLWLPLLWALEIVFVCGLVMATSALNVYIRDTRYVVESATTVLFWVVPIFYSFSVIPARFRPVYEFNPVAAIVLLLRSVLLDHEPPNPGTLVKLAAVSVLTFAAGWFLFRRMRSTFFEYI